MAESGKLLHNLHQMRHFRHHAANRRRVRTFNHLIQASKSQSLNHFLVLHRGRDCRTHVFQPQSSSAGSVFFRRHHSSSAALPRTPATSSLFLSFLSASKVALMTLWGLVVPIDLVSTF